MRSTWILPVVLSLPMMLVGCRSLSGPEVQPMALGSPGAVSAVMPTPARSYPDLPLKQMTPSQSAARMH